MFKKNFSSKVFILLFALISLFLVMCIIDGKAGLRHCYAEPPCEGDFDGDRDVDGSDLAVFAADFGRTDCASGPSCEGDFDGDNDVDGSDLAVFAADFGRTDCP